MFIKDEVKDMEILSDPKSARRYVIERQSTGERLLWFYNGAHFMMGTLFG